MKVTPIAQGTGSPAGLDNSSQRMPADKIAKAKAIAQGITITESDTPVDPLVQAQDRSIRKIKMKTQVSPDRFDPRQETVAENTQSVAEVPQESATVDDTEQAKSGSEETKPLSPQFAALARQKRALQVKERELAEREAKLTAPNMEEYVSKADLQSNPLKVFEAGVTYDQLTEAILNNSSNSPEIQELRKEIKALKEGVDKNLSERDAQAERQVLAEMKKQAEQLVSSGDDFELVREQGYVPQAIELIHQTWKKTGEILDVQEALALVEDELITEATKIAQFKKVQSKLTPQQNLQQQQQPRTMRTLTNRDTATRPLSAKERAIAAFYGTLRK